MTKIEWTDEVWNPVTGCTKVSQGCKHCYAERMAKRLAGRAGYPAAPNQFDVTLHPDRLNIPLGWCEPRRVFVNSMSDLFHKDVPFEFILRTWIVMATCHTHTFQVLTKRPERMNIFITDWLPGAWGLATMSLRLLDKPIPNIWLGVSVENQATADERIPWLLKTPAAVRFVSYEPALGPVDFTALNFGTSWESSALDGWYATPDGRDEPDQHGDGNKLNWIISGCESGPGARSASPDWFMSVRDQCVEAGIPFFLKQMVINGKMVKMPELDGKVWDQYPEAKS